MIPYSMPAFLAQTGKMFRHGEWPVLVREVLEKPVGLVFLVSGTDVAFFAKNRANHLKEREGHLSFLMNPGKPRRLPFIRSSIGT